MAVGVALGLLGVALPMVELAIALLAVILGLFVLTEWRSPAGVAAVLVGLFALFHGHAHGTELPPGASGALYSVGFVVATGALHGTGIALGLVHRWRAGLAIRAAGLGIIAGGAPAWSSGCAEVGRRSWCALPGAGSRPSVFCSLPGRCGRRPDLLPLDRFAARARCYER
jgi:hypothetical protein